MKAAPQQGISVRRRGQHFNGIESAVRLTHTRPASLRSADQMVKDPCTGVSTAKETRTSTKFQPLVRRMGRMLRQLFPALCRATRSGQQWAISAHRAPFHTLRRLM
jgi:hypothetical protein